MPLSTGSTGSHRAFMGVCATLCVCLVLTLFVGWNWYIESRASRNTLIELAKKAEARAKGLEKMGLKFDIDEPPSAPTSPDSLPTPNPAPAPVPAPAPMPVSPTSIQNDATSAAAPSTAPGGVPMESTIKELPLMESSDEVANALSLLDQYWKTEKWQDKIPLVAHSSRVAGMMKDYYETQKGEDPLPGGIINKARYQIDGIEILYFSYTSSRPNGTLEVAMLRGPDGRFLIDWESLTGYGEMSFRDFREKRPDKPVTLRTYARLFDYFNFEFSDASKFLCIKLTSENGESSIYAYCKRGTELARWLERDLAQTGPTGFKGYALQVSFPPGAQSNQCVNLDKLINPRWLSLR